MRSQIQAPSKPAKFPLLAKADASKEIVVFTAEDKGFVLVAGAVSRPVGFVVNSYVHDEDYWEILPTGTQVILTQV